MTKTTEPVAAHPAQVALVHDPRGLHAFLEPECAAALWGRDAPKEVLEGLAVLEQALLPKGRVVCPAASAATIASQLCIISGMPNGRVRDWLEADIAQLASLFADVMGASFLRVRLDVVTTNACRKFHVDAITARLVCTYRGTGTQYGVTRTSDDPQHIFTCPTGAPILLRGSLWPETPASGLKHRSPPIEGTGETRLVLVLDPANTPEGDM